MAGREDEAVAVRAACDALLPARGNISANNWFYLAAEERTQLAAALRKLGFNL